MKKLLTLIAVLALTAPVFAADGDPNVLITCVDEGNGVVRVEYDLLAEDGFVPGDNLLRGIALDITTSNTATIEVIKDYDAEGASTPVDSEGIDDTDGFIIYMGSIQFAADPNYVSSFGDPVAPIGHAGTVGELGDTGITVEMGTLYSDNGTPPPTSGILFRLELDCQGEASTVLTIAGNTTRGGDLGEAVLEDGAQANVVSAGCTIDCVTECYVVGQQRGSAGCNAGTITQANYDAWVLNGSPDEWCCPWQPCGDTNGDGFVNASDYSLITGNPAAPASQAPGADTNHDGFINASDYAAVTAHPAGGNGVACPPLP
jgi:hypothetical protein